MGRKRSIKKVILSMLAFVLIFCAIVLIVGHIKFPASFLFLTVQKTGIYDILDKYPTVSIENIENEYSKISLSNKANKEKLLEKTLFVADAMYLKYFTDELGCKNYNMAIPYLEFINSKTSNLFYITNMWQCYLMANKFDDFLLDYKERCEKADEKTREKANISLAIFLTIESDLSIEQRKEYSRWLRSEINERIKASEEENDTYLYIIDSVIDPFLNNDKSFFE